MNACTLKQLSLKVSDQMRTKSAMYTQTRFTILYYTCITFDAYIYIDFTGKVWDSLMS